MCSFNCKTNLRHPGSAKGSSHHGLRTPATDAFSHGTAAQSCSVNTQGALSSHDVYKQSALRINVFRETSEDVCAETLFIAHLMFYLTCFDFATFGPLACDPAASIFQKQTWWSLRVAHPPRGSAHLPPATPPSKAACSKGSCQGSQARDSLSGGSGGQRVEGRPLKGHTGEDTWLHGQRQPPLHWRPSAHSSGCTYS